MDSTQPTSRAVPRLAGANIPADHGLASLGLLMQLGGSLYLGVMAMIALMPLFAPGFPGAWVIFLIGAAGAVRSAFHRSAGAGLIYGSPAGPWNGVRVYVILSVIQTLVTLVLLNSQMDMPGKQLLPLALLLLAWPATLAVVGNLPRFKAMSDEVPQGEDLGFEGVAVLMSILGITGAIFSALLLWTLLKLPGQMLSSGPGMLFVGVFGMLLARSVLHAVAGFRGTTGSDRDRATEAATKYFSFGVISSVVAGAALMILMMLARFEPMGLLMVGMVVYLLLIWPLALRRFYTERNFTVLLAGEEAPTYRRAPDLGLTSLGWVLLAFGVLGMAQNLPTAIFGPTGGDGIGPFGAFMGGDANMLAAMGRSTWWMVGVNAVQLWAAIELLRMSDVHKMAANIYGVVAVVVHLYVYWPVLKSLEQLGGFGGRGGGMDSMLNNMMYGGIAIALVIPVGAIILVNRKVTPDAQVRMPLARTREPMP